MIRDAHAVSRRNRGKARHSRVFLNGVDVSHCAFYADTRAGVVRLYQLNLEGRKCLHPFTSRAAIEERHGVVWITASAGR